MLLLHASPRRRAASALRRTIRLSSDELGLRRGRARGLAKEELVDAYSAAVRVASRLQQRLQLGQQRGAIVWRRVLDVEESDAVRLPGEWGVFKPSGRAK